MAFAFELRNVFGNAIIPVNIILAVHSNAFIVREDFRPVFLIAVFCPVVSVKSSPKNSPAVIIKVVACPFMPYARIIKACFLAEFFNGIT